MIANLLREFRVAEESMAGCANDLLSTQGRMGSDS